MEHINKPSISVIIVTVGRPLLITRAINSILKQDYSCCEIIIGDVSKNSKTEEIIRNIDNNIIKYIKFTNEKDPALTINSLIAQAKGELIYLYCFSLSYSLFIYYYLIQDIYSYHHKSSQS